MSLEARVRIAVSRRIWRSNPHSATIAAAAVGMARLIDEGNSDPMLAEFLRTALSHLSSCEAEPDMLDKIRADYCQNRLACFPNHASDLQ